MVVEVAPDHRPKPPPHRGDGVVPMGHEPLADLLALCPEAFGEALPLHGEPSVTPPLPAQVREAEEGERFRLALTASGTVLKGEPSKLA